jgi:NAD(P)-dependent dehydrogenase (short-subunit alcohol dehydrogenase family)
LSASSERRPSGCWPSAIARIVAVDRREQDLRSAIAELPASAEALAVTADVTDKDEVAGDVRAAVDTFGTIDVFYDNAGVEGEVKPITDCSLAAFRLVGRRPPPSTLGSDSVDLMIAATALEHGLTVVTPYVSDFEPTGVAVFDPLTCKPNPKKS